MVGVVGLPWPIVEQADFEIVDHRYTQSKEYKKGNRSSLKTSVIK